MSCTFSVRTVFFSSFLLLLFRFSAPSCAQELGEWENLTQLPGQSLADFWPGDSVVGVRDVRGQLLLSRDGGDTWEPKGFQAQGLHIGSAGSLVALSDAGDLFYSSDNGRNFQQVADGLIPQTGYLTLLGEGNFVYVVDYGDQETRYFLSRDGGETWEEIDGLSEKNGRFAVGPDGAFYALKASQNQVMRYNVGDNTWSVALTFHNLLTDIRFGRDGRLYAVTVRDSLYRSGVGDVELAPFAVDYRFATGFAVNSRGELYTPQPPGPGEFFSRFSADGGRKEDIPVNISFRDEPRLVFGPHDDLWVVYGDYGAYHFDSSASEYIWTPVVFPGYGSVHQLDVSPGGKWVIQANRRAYLSEDQGNTLIPMNLPGEVISIYDNLLFVDSTTLLFTTPGTAFESTDFGATWGGAERQAMPFHRVENGTLFSLGTIFAQKSTDKGLTWTRINAIRGPLMFMGSYGSRVYGITPTTIHSSSDWGETWDTAWATNLLLPTSIVTAGGTLIGGPGIIDTNSLGVPVYITYHFDSASSVDRTLPCDAMKTSYRFARDPLGRPWLATTCGLFRSDDEGASWTKVADVPEGRQPTALLISEDEEFFLGTNEGLFRAEPTSSVNSRQSAGGERGVGVLATPNPVRGEGTIHFVLATSSHVRIGLYDGLGRQVQTIVAGEYGAGAHAIAWNVPEGFAAGSYVLSIVTENGSAAQKVIVVPE